MSMPLSSTGDPNFLKMHGSLLAGYGNMGSLVMPSTPSLPNLPTKASVSPPLSPQVSCQRGNTCSAVLEIGSHS